MSTRIRYSDHSPRHCTGGQASRDCAEMLNMPGRWCLYGSIGTLSHEFDAGGPIDAPDAIPAGSVNSTEYRTGPWAANNGRGIPVAAISTYRRG